MAELDDRPDPDALLERLKKDEERARRGKLKVFFGFAPGVGKTFRMLEAAHALGEGAFVDVVVGVVETHKRKETEALVAGLEVIPRRSVEYRGRTLEEFDVDAVLARKPKVVLVDELAHSNAPGSRHTKRWQDVEEILEAGIDVLTTVNVQHIESLNDVVAQITHVQVRETVPDSVLDRADAIEVVDVAPEVLLSRLREGKVYWSEQAARAAEHFFRRGNLLALRELALRRTAQHVDEDVREYREEHGVVATWPAGERILVCVGAAPSSGRLIRATARMAAGLRCPWVAAYVESPSGATMGSADRERLEAHLRVAETLGGSVTRLSGTLVSGALLTYARKHNVTRIVLGKPTHSRLWDRLRGSLVDEVVRGSGDIDVHVIHGDQVRAGSTEPVARVREYAPASHYAAAVGLSIVTLGLALGLRAAFDVPDPEMLFLLSAMLAGSWLGRGPSLVAAGFAVALYDLFFVEPFYTFSVADRRYVLTFAMMFGVGVVMSELMRRIRGQERHAVAREERTASLYALTKELADAGEKSNVASLAAKHASHAFASSAFVLLDAGDGVLAPHGTAPSGAQFDAKDLGVAKWSFEHDTTAGLGSGTLPGARSVCVPLRAGGVRHGVLALVPVNGAPLSSDQRTFLDVFARQVATALERARLAAEARSAQLRATTEEMRSSLLSSVSHDLRTPLASITGAATVLRDDENLAASTEGELVQAIVDEAARLERLVANLLDMTRLDSGGVSPKREWVPLDEIVGSALTRLEARLADRKVRVDIEEGVSWALVDPVLIEQLFVNLLENADKYTPAGSSLEIIAHAGGDGVIVDVLDHGPGIPKGAEDKVFEKFFRGEHTTPSGAGLGLAICRGIVLAHSGALTASNREGGGACFRVVLPNAGPAPHEGAGAPL